MSVPASFIDQLDVLNDACMDTFGSETINYQRRVASADYKGDVDLQAIPIDPLRLEGLSNGNFAVRWIRSKDLDEAGIVPQKGDVVTLGDSELTTGGLYTVIQMQKEVGGGFRLILEKRSS